MPCMLVTSSLPTDEMEDTLQQEGQPPVVVNSNRRITEQSVSQ